MLRSHVYFLILAAVSTGAAAQQQALGIFGLWGAFADPGRCWAVSEPERRLGGREGRPYASVGFWPREGARGQIHFRLGRAKRAGSAVLLRIDRRTFQLVGGGTNAWAADPRADAEIVAAMRSGLEMTIETRSERGSLLRDSYGLRGAATAIDAAAIACSRR